MFILIINNNGIFKMFVLIINNFLSLLNVYSSFFCMAHNMDIHYGPGGQTKIEGP